MKYLRHTFYVFLVLYLAMVSLPAVVLADVAHVVSPRTIDVTVQPGDIVQRVITVTNNHPHRIHVYPSVHGLHVVNGVFDESAEVVPADETEFTNWLTMSRAAQQLESGASTSVAVTFTIPRNVEAGVYHGLLGFGRGVSRPVAEQQVVNGIAPQVVLRFVVPEREVDGSAALRFETSPIVVVDNQSAIRYTIHNPSTGTVVPVGDIRIFNKRGAEVAVVPLNPDGKSFATGAVQSFTELAPDLAHIGEYRAEARVSFGTEQLAALSASESFFYIPWQWLLGLFVLLLVVAVLLYRLLRKQFNYVPAADRHEHSLPLHVYEGRSPDEDHDINLKQ